MAPDYRLGVDDVDTPEMIALQLEFVKSFRAAKVNSLVHEPLAMPHQKRLTLLLSSVIATLPCILRGMRLSIQEMIPKRCHQFGDPVKIDRVSRRAAVPLAPVGVHHDDPAIFERDEMLGNTRLAASHCFNDLPASHRATPIQVPSDFIPPRLPAAAPDLGGEPEQLPRGHQDRP